MVNSSVAQSHKKSSTDWIRVTKDNPCPICQKPDWCMIAADGTAAICARTESIKRCGEAGYLHKLDGTPVEFYSSATTQGSKMAGADRRHEVYSSMMELLTLNKQHLADLKKRGLPDDIIAYNGYKTLPDGNRAALTAKTKESVIGVKGVPGFYLADNNVPTLNGAPGLLIPVRDSCQRIAGVQIRRDKADSGGKYIWLSSYGKQGGVGAGSPAHLAMPVDCRTTDIIVITEGPLKADIIAYFMGCPVIGVAGVAAWRRAMDIVYQLLPRKVVLAYDNDKMLNEVVYRNARELEKALLFNHRYTYEAVWPAEYKGLDDYLASGAGQLGFKVIKDVPKVLSAPYKDTVAKSYNYAQWQPERVNRDTWRQWQSLLEHTAGRSNRDVFEFGVSHGLLKPLNQPPDVTRPWAHLDSSREKASHIIAPLDIPPWCLNDCQCEYCTAVRLHIAKQRVVA